MKVLLIIVISLGLGFKLGKDYKYKVLINIIDKLVK